MNDRLRKLIEAVVVAGPRDIEKAVARLGLESVDTPASFIDLAAGRRFACALLGLEATILEELDAAPRERVSYESDEWACEFLRFDRGNFRVFHMVRSLRLPSRAAGLVHIESGFDDLDHHPRVGAGAGATVYRVYDLDAGWLVCFSTGPVVLHSAPDEVQADRVRRLVRSHLAVVTRHARARPFGPVTVADVDAFRDWANALIGTSASDSIALPPGIDVELVSSPSLRDLVRLRVVAREEIIERVLLELNRRFGAES